MRPERITPGAVVGLIAAEDLSDMRTIRVTVFALEIAALLVLLNPSKWLNADPAVPVRASGPLIMVAVFAVGLWGPMPVNGCLRCSCSSSPGKRYGWVSCFCDRCQDVTINHFGFC